MNYTPGLGGVAVGVATGGVVGGILPVTGSNTAIQLAIATAAGLIAWAAVYVIVRKRSVSN